MKKRNILNLIKYHVEKNDDAFRSEAYEVARFFDRSGDIRLAEYIISLMSSANTFVPQIRNDNLTFFKKMELSSTPLPLPNKIEEDIVGIINAIGHNIGVNKFLFEGAPGTGKTETVKQIARILQKELFIVDFSCIIDSKLGQTQRNISELFNEIRNFKNPEKIIILFDEMDALAIDRINSNDLREMGRATSAVFKGLDEVNDKVTLIATTNLFSSFDKALVRRFDATINFNRYSRDDLLDISVIMLNDLLSKFKFAGKNIKLFKKIINLMNTIPYPGELKNLIKSSLAFSSSENNFDYLQRLYKSIKEENCNDLQNLKQLGFTVREIEVLTGISKSKVFRELKGE